MTDKTRLSTFSLPASVMDAVVDLAQDTNVSINTIVTAALEQFLNRADRQADIAQARNDYIDAKARYDFGPADTVDTYPAYLEAGKTLVTLLEQEETP